MRNDGRSEWRIRVLEPPASCCHARAELPQALVFSRVFLTCCCSRHSGALLPARSGASHRLTLLVVDATNATQARRANVHSDTSDSTSRILRRYPVWGMTNTVIDHRLMGDCRVGPTSQHLVRGQARPNLKLSNPRRGGLSMCSQMTSCGRSCRSGHEPLDGSLFSWSEIGRQVIGRIALSVFR